MKVVWIAAFVLFLSSCSTNFAYNNLQWLIHWYVDDYIELNKTQKKRFDEQFEQWMAWHRAEELERYKGHLREIRALLEQQSITKEQALAQFERARGHWIRLRAHILPGLAELAMSMSAQQVDELFTSLEEKNAEQEQERLDMTQEEVVTSFQEKVEDELKDYMGRLTIHQKLLTSNASVQISPNLREWIRYRRTFQAAARRILDQKDTNPEFKAEFVNLLNRPEAFKHQSYVENYEKNREVFAKLVADVFASMTLKQKTRLLGEVDNLIEDISALQERAPRP